jgi:hypothetical protein
VAANSAIHARKPSIFMELALGIEVSYPDRGSPARSMSGGPWTTASIKNNRRTAGFAAMHVAKSARYGKCRCCRLPQLVLKYQADQ